jgi:hypothetical protein
VPCVVSAPHYKHISQDLALYLYPHTDNSMTQYSYTHVASGSWQVSTRKYLS